MMNRAILVLLFLLSALPFSLQAQMPDSIVRKLSGYIEAVQNFGEMLPQEKSIYISTIPVIIRETLFGFSVML